MNHYEQYLKRNEKLADFGGYNYVSRNHEKLGKGLIMSSMILPDFKILAIMGVLLLKLSLRLIAFSVKEKIRLSYYQKKMRWFRK